MEHAEAQERFRRADAHYRAQRYREALVELELLAAAQPQNPLVLDAKARTLEHLGRHDDALDLFERLVNDFDYESAEPRRARLAARLGLVRGTPGPTTPTAATANPASLSPKPAEETDENGPAEEPRRWLRIKPVRLLVLIALTAGMYFGYVPYWLGGGLIAAYFLLKFALRRLFANLSMVPFRMKGKALAGATAEIHGVEWTNPPAGSPDDDDEEAREPRPLRYVWIDVTITPPVRTQGFTHWEPGELALALAKPRYRGPDDLGTHFPVREVRFVTDAGEQDDEGYKCAGPQRIKILAGVPLDENVFRFAYYFESFGEFTLNA